MTGVQGIILAGGQGQRLGGEDKGLTDIRGRPLIAYVLAGLRPQVQRIAINANRNRAAYEALGHSVFADEFPNYPGPLAGIAAGMAAARAEQVQFTACDTPHLPADLVARLQRSLAGGAPAAAPHDGIRLQPTHALIRRDQVRAARAALTAGHRSPLAWLESIGTAVVDCQDVAECFSSLNTPADCAAFAAESRPFDSRPAPEHE